MKKFALFFIAILLCVSSFSQKGLKIYTSTSATATFKGIYNPGDIVVNTANKAMYIVLLKVGTKDYITSAVAANPAKMAALYYATGSGYVDTTNAQNVYGIKTFHSPIAFHLGSSKINDGIGSGVFAALTSGIYNVGIGADALSKITSNSLNTIVGVWGGRNIVSSANTGVGHEVLNLLTSGAYNTAQGVYSLGAVQTGSYNTAQGFSSGVIAEGSYNTYLGAYSAGYASGGSSGTLNTAVGYKAMYKPTSTYMSTAVGDSSLYSVTTGIMNTGIGRASLATCGSGGYNTAIGNEALRYTNGNQNIAIGWRAGKYATGNNKLIIHNNVGGSDTAIIYGVMGATPAASLLQVNAPLQIMRGDTTGLGIVANVGIIVFYTTTGSFYGYTGTGSGHAWKKLDN